VPAEDVAEWSGEGSNTQGEREGGRGSKHRKTRARKKPRIDLTAMDKNNRGPRHANQFGGKKHKKGRCLEYLEPLPGRQLALAVLDIDPLVTPSLDRLVSERVQVRCKRSRPRGRGLRAMEVNVLDRVRDRATPVTLPAHRGADRKIPDQAPAMGAGGISGRRGLMLF